MLCWFNDLWWWASININRPRTHIRVLSGWVWSPGGGLIYCTAVLSIMWHSHAIPPPKTKPRNSSDLQLHSFWVLTLQISLRHLNTLTYHLTPPAAAAAAGVNHYFIWHLTPHVILISTSPVQQLVSIFSVNEAGNCASNDEKYLYLWKIDISKNWWYD